MPRVIAPVHPKVLPGTIADWRRALAMHYKSLGRVSRLRRFMTVSPDSALQTIADRANPDLVLGVRADGHIIGVLELFKDDDAHAEIGISVEDAYQGQGFGKALFLDGLSAADRLGVSSADLYFASENQGIRNLVLAAGGQILQQGPECEAHIDIKHFISCHDPDHGAESVGTHLLLH